MSVTTVKNNNNGLGILGGLATGLGMVTGQPWLGALGTGLGAANSMMNGNANPQTVGTLGEALKGVLDSWVNPASGNVASTKSPLEQELEKRNFIWRV